MKPILFSGLRLVLAISLIGTGRTVAGSNKGKDLNWQTGTVIDTNRAKDLAFVHHTGNSNGNIHANTDANGTTTGTYSGTTSGMSAPVYRVYEDYAIDDGKYIYLAEEHLRWRWSKPARLIVNAPLQFAVDRNRLFIRDEDGNIHEAKITKQILKR